MRLRDLGLAERKRCLALRVGPEQVEFVPNVASSLELAAAYPDARPMAIVVGSDVVGFSMYGIDEASGLWKIFRLMVDQKWQGKGIGRAAVQELVRILTHDEGAKRILVSYHRDNERARALYLAQGFEEQSVARDKVTACLNVV